MTEMILMLLIFGLFLLGMLILTAIIFEWIINKIEEKKDE